MNPGTKSLLALVTLLACIKVCQTGAKSESAKEFLIKVIVPTYKKTVETYSALTKLLCNQKARSAKDFDDLPPGIKSKTQNTLKELTKLSHQMCFDANKLLKKTRLEGSEDEAKTNEMRKKTREMDAKKQELKSLKAGAKDKVKQREERKKQLEDKLKLKQDELEEVKRKITQSEQKCRRRRKRQAMMGNMKAVRCEFARVIRKKKKDVEKEIADLKSDIKKAKMAEANAVRQEKDEGKKLNAERKNLDKAEETKKNNKIQEAKAQMELQKSKKLIEQIRVLQGQLQNVHEGITKDVKVIDRDLPAIVISMRKVNIGLSGFSTGQGKVPVPDLSFLMKKAGKAEKDTIKAQAIAKEKQ